MPRQPLVPLHLCIDSHLCRCIVQRLCVAVFMHPCITALCDRYRASLHDPQVAGSPSRCTKKSRVMPVCGSGSGAGCRIAVVWVAASCSDFVRPPSCILARRACSVGFVSCETLGKHYHASLRLRSFGSARPCADFARPPSCILCTFMNALLVSHPCETLGVHFIRHPCLTRKLRVLPPTNT